MASPKKDKEDNDFVSWEIMELSMLVNIVNMLQKDIALQFMKQATLEGVPLQDAFVWNRAPKEAFNILARVPGWKGRVAWQDNVLLTSFTVKDDAFMRDTLAERIAAVQKLKDAEAAKDKADGVITRSYDETTDTTYVVSKATCDTEAEFDQIEANNQRIRAEVAAALKPNADINV
jgi:hypothetical protein